MPLSKETETKNVNMTVQLTRLFNFEAQSYSIQVDMPLKSIGFGPGMYSRRYSVINNFVISEFNSKLEYHNFVLVPN